jgi:hypothetical protein
MSSSLRIQASRANGARSRGPVTEDGKRASAANSAKSTGAVTPEGKSRSAQNATRHGLLSESIVLDDECAENFALVLSLLEDELNPVTGIEQRFVETMALAQWRQLRLWTVEKVQIDREARKQYLERYGQEFNSDNEVDNRPVTFAALAFRAMSDESRALELVGRLDARYDRQYKSALSSFNAHRRARLKEARREARRALSRAAIDTGTRDSGGGTS